MVTLATPALTPNALRQRRFRERQRTPIRAVAWIECERDAVLQALIHSGRLSETETQADIWRDRPRMRQMLSDVIAEWAETTNKRFQKDQERSMLVFKVKDNSQLPDFDDSADDGV